MASSSESPWSDNPNAPQIPYLLYFVEKATFAGTLLGAIFYGTPTHVSAYMCSSFSLIHRSRDRHYCQEHGFFTLFKPLTSLV